MSLNTANSGTKSLQRLAMHLMSYDREMTLSRVLLFTLVARADQKRGALVRDLIKATGLNQSTIARSLAHLSDKPQRGQKRALHWVEAHPDPDDPRRVRVFVTPNGLKVLEEVAAVLN